MKKTAQKKYYLLLSYLLTFVGFIAFTYGCYLLWLRFAPARFAELSSVAGVPFEIADSEASDSARLKAVQLLVEEREMQVPLITGSVDAEGNWKLSNDAGLVIQSAGATASESGTIIYGHNFSRILGGLNKVQVGDEVELLLSDWSTEKYLVVDVAQVAPEDVISVVEGDERELVIYTCSGFLDSKRLVVRAERV